MHMQRLIFPAAFLAVLIARPAFAADEKPLKGDLAKIQGAWTTKIGPEQNLDAVVTFRGTEVKLKLTTPDGQDFELTGEIKLDEEAKPHKTIDWAKFKTPNGDDAPDNLGIYEIVDKDTVKVCNGGPNNPRPKEMKAGDGGDPHILTLKRKADKPEAKPVELKGDLAKFQGSWTSALGPEKNVPITVTIKENTVSLVITLQGEDRTMKGEVKLDAAAKPFKTLDWVNFKGPNGEDFPVNLGIYKFDGDKLTVCSGGPGNARPTEFKDGEQGGQSLATFTKKPTGK